MTKTYLLSLNVSIDADSENEARDKAIEEYGVQHDQINVEDVIEREEKKDFLDDDETKCYGIF